MNCSLLLYKVLKSKLPAFVFSCMQIIQDADGEAYLVGGVTRDAILMKEKYLPEDIDIACSLPWTKTKNILKMHGWTVIETGTKHGTITALPPKCIRPSSICNKIEITTYRNDGTYTDNRHPDNISTVKSIYEDLKRRDFTVNAIAWNDNASIVDSFNGVNDIKSCTIRAVGNASKRFDEDALRILRALRFAARLNFTIDTNTLEAAYKKLGKLKNISGERVRDEITKTLISKFAFNALLNYNQIIAAAIPELNKIIGCKQNTKYHCDDVYTHTIKVIKSIDWAVDYLQYNLAFHEYIKLKWAALLHDIGKPACHTIGKNGQDHFYNHPEQSVILSKGILKRLHFSKQDINWICLLIKYHDAFLKNSEKDILKFLNKINAELKNDAEIKFLINLLIIKASDKKEHDVRFNNTSIYPKIAKTLNKIKTKKIPYKICQLNISGKDIIDAGIEEGPAVKEILESCLNNILNGSIKNTKTEILNYINVEYLNAKDN